MADSKVTGISFNTQKKPFDVKIDNNRKEPKLSKNVRYTDKQNYRRYKTLTEPKLLSRIMVEPQDSETISLEQKLMKLMGSYKEPELQEYEKQLKARLAEQNANVFTAENPYVEPPNPKEVRMASKDEYLDYFTKNFANQVLDDAVNDIDIQGFALGNNNGINAINEVSKNDVEELLNSVIDDAFDIAQIKEEKLKIIAQSLTPNKQVDLSSEEAIMELISTIDNQDTRFQAMTDLQQRQALAKELFSPEQTASEISGATTVPDRPRRGRPTNASRKEREQAKRFEDSIKEIKKAKTQNRGKSEDFSSSIFDREKYSSLFQF